METTQADAIELSGIEIHGMTREAFLMRSALAAGAMYGLSAVSPFIRTAIAQEGMDDIDILNFALTLEYLEAAFYEKAVDQAKLSGEVKQIAQEFGDHESRHVEALKGTIDELGGSPVSAPKVSFPMNNTNSFLKLAGTLEDTGVYAYNGAAPAIRSMNVLAAAGSIVQIEGRHAAVIRMINNDTPAPDAFDKTLSTDQVLSAVKPFIRS